MLNLRYYDDGLPMRRQAELLERHSKKQLARRLRRAEEARAPQPEHSSRRPATWLPALPRLARPWA